MDQKYFPKKVEKKWQERWAENGTFEARPDDEREKYYCLEMLPYPSGRLHMGHVRNYSIGDALAWWMRLNGFNVIHPIGWDSFGQPAEQAAIKQGVNPRDWTEDNISQMKAQLKTLGIGYDWSREIAAHRPDYYKFDQWFFLKMLEMGLAYRKESEVNWCPKCETTLSNEQASGGICWRCGTPVEKQSRPQWFLKITAYADELLQGMDEIENGWPEKVLTMQKNWIGKSVGANIDFAVKGSPGGIDSVRVFTTRIDTIYGANAIVVAPGHPLIEANAGSFPDQVKAKIESIEAEHANPKDYEEEIEKDGIDIGLVAVNPFSGEELPVWVGNYVMMSYGTGAVMSVPGHDERDHEFASKFGLPIVPVIEPASEDGQCEKGKAFTEKGRLVNSGDWSGMASAEAIREMTAFAEKEGFGEKAVTYRLRDWGISRQRFWGAPIPIIHCDQCGAVPVPFDDLPVELPESAPFTGVGESPLAKVDEFVNVDCPKCGAKGRRETDTMDTFVDSTWYYFRYCDPRNDEMPFDPAVAKYWLPVDLYIGGIDHAVMHLLYTRFWTKAMRDMGLVGFDEPAKRLLTQGMVVGESFYSKTKETYVFEDEVEFRRDEQGRIEEAVLRTDGSPVKVAVEKMSKSKHNGVDPDDMISIYGADAVRLFVLFAAPAENELVWQESGIEGAVRFLQRVWRFVLKWRDSVSGIDLSSGAPDEISKEAANLRRKTHQTILRIRENFESRQFNTPVAALMELSNALGDVQFEPESATDAERYAVREALETLIVMLTPYAPHYCEELWEAVTGSDKGILASGARIPLADEAVAAEEEIEIAVQVNGKLRSRVHASPDASNADLEALALADEKVKEYTEGKQVLKVIVVPGRLVNVVVK
ncbi:MAG: leucine--tRNA ligase [Aridibacter famidurans]|nr:leucine--tRNA ligase [Aridibacter famidurans]